VLEKLSRGMKNVQVDEQDMTWFSYLTSLIEIHLLAKVFSRAYVCVLTFLYKQRHKCESKLLHPLYNCHPKLFFPEKVYFKHFYGLV
jgi:hypothetical protein